ncbi:hypothetical protein [Euzebya rosea]|uniref:hypothetical protein n=1 Tax=Euzebya rosea TaxID=2052804 RepID=UPI000D3ECA2B|nr:hypothetical protein [Euzebya rosea]
MVPPVQGGQRDLRGRRPCPFLTAVGVDDVVRVWAEIRGELSYSTTLGGTSHAVSFHVVDAELITDN